MINDKLGKLIEEMIGEVEEVCIDLGVSSFEMVDQDIICVSVEEDKFFKLLELLGRQGMDKVIVFVEKKYFVDCLMKKLVKFGVLVDVIYGNKLQNYCIKVFDKFCEGKICVLVVIDVVVCGIDVQDVLYVVNYQILKDYEMYIYCVGRIGCVGKNGKVFMFVDEEVKN